MESALLWKLSIGAGGGQKAETLCGGARIESAGQANAGRFGAGASTIYFSRGPCAPAEAPEALAGKGAGSTSTRLASPPAAGQCQGERAGRSFMPPCALLFAGPALANQWGGQRSLLLFPVSFELGTPLPSAHPRLPGPQLGASGVLGPLLASVLACALPTPGIIVCAEGLRLLHLDPPL